MCSIEHLLILVALASLLLDIWQSFRNKMAEAANEKRVEEYIGLFQFDICFCFHMQMFLLSSKISHAQYLFWGGKYMVNTPLIPSVILNYLIPEIRLAFSSNHFCEQHSLLSRAQTNRLKDSF